MIIYFKKEKQKFKTNIRQNKNRIKRIKKKICVFPVTHRKKMGRQVLFFFNPAYMRVKIGENRNFELENRRPCVQIFIVFRKYKNLF